MRLTRCASKNPIKLGAITDALRITRPNELFDVRGLPVELQSAIGFDVHAQPEGLQQTLLYAQMRLSEMCSQHGLVASLDVVVESGAIDGEDVAVVVLKAPSMREITVVLSRGIPFPPGVLDEARRRGFRAVTAGDVIHEKWPHIPSNNWHEHFPPYVSRRTQIRDAVIQGLQQVRL